MTGTKAATKSPLPSAAGQVALLHMAAGRPGNHGLSGMSASGGYFQTVRALLRAGLIVNLCDEQLTEAGEAMVARIKDRKARR